MSSPRSLFGPEVQAAFDAVSASSSPSPPDWRDYWIYFLMVDRFHNPSAPPACTAANPPIAYDEPFGRFQGGTFEGIRQKLAYLRDLGAGAIWLSPVLKNCQYESGTFHGYGIQDFLTAEPRFASNRAAADYELRALVDEIHARGMYVIFDIVLNHAGNVFGYVVGDNDNAPAADFRDEAYAIRWHDENGHPAFPNIAAAPQPLSADAAVWPVELQANAHFRRQGQAADRPGAIGDFVSLKQMVSEDPDVQTALIRAYQYVIARFDCDGFRIDTFKVPNAEFGHTFCAAMREFALSIGKRNFFTFGEITVGESDLRRFIGRDTKAPGSDTVGIDSALDFALEGNLGAVVKHADPNQPAPPTFLAGMYQARKNAEREVITTHGEASGFFITFLDNHDRSRRFYFQDPADPHRWDNQVTLALGLLFSLQGIPCVYYGTEQGLHGIGGSDAAVREALWGKPGAFDPTHPFYIGLQNIAAVRAAQPALRYGRQYFRQISGNGRDFAVSFFTPGVVAFSRILNSEEVVVIANTSAEDAFSGEVIVDAILNSAPGTFRILFSNIQNSSAPGPLRTAAPGSVSIAQLEGGITFGPARVLPVTVQSLEVQILRR